MPTQPSGPPHDETLNESPARDRTALARPEAYLVVALESERPVSGSSRHALRGIDEVTLGRGDERLAKREGRRLELTLPSRWMSSVHARILRGPQGWRLEDAGSRNGTMVNGQTVAHVVLGDGDVIEVGRTLGIFREALHAPPGTPADFDSRQAVFPAPGLRTVIPALAEEMRTLGADTAISVNVIEHIERDDLALRHMIEGTKTGGHICLLVPAHPFLYGTLDSLDHHFRRYTKATLRDLVARAGGGKVEWVDLYHFNAIASFGWFLKGRVLKETKQADENWAVMNMVLPFVSRAEKLVKPPFGLSLVAILRRVSP